MGRQIVSYSVLWVANFQALRTTALKCHVFFKCPLKTFLHHFVQDDFVKKKAFKCSYCKKPIVPKDGEKTAPRLRAMGKDFHPDCFKCEVRRFSSSILSRGQFHQHFRGSFYTHRSQKRKKDSQVK